MKATKLVLPLLIALAYAPVQAFAGTTTVLGGDLNYLSVFSDTYTSMGANSIVYGNILAGGVTTVGGSGQVFGNVTSPEAVTLSGLSTSGRTPTVTGSILSGDVLTTGQNAQIDGSLTSSGTTSIGNTSTVKGDVLAWGVTSLGKDAKVTGNVVSGGAVNLGDLANVHGNLSVKGVYTPGNGTVDGTTDTNPPAIPSSAAAFKQTQVDKVNADSALVSAAQVALHSLVDSSAAKMGFNALGQTITSALAATMTVDTTLDAGVYSAASLSITATKTLFLDAHNKDNQSWVFNISDILETDGYVNVELIHAGANESVIWNVLNPANPAGAYVALGAHNNFLGTLLANIGIEVGANTTVTGPNNTCGGVYSATSFVSAGDGAVIGGNGCKVSLTPNGVSSVPEPGSLAMLLSGLGMLGFMVGRKKQA